MDQHLTNWSGVRALEWHESTSQTSGGSAKKAMAAIGGAVAPAPNGSSCPDRYYSAFVKSSGSLRFVDRSGMGKIAARTPFNGFHARMEAAKATIPPISNASPPAEVLNTWRNADAVCFDVDSTVCIDEGIDELANFCGAGEAVAAWTRRAMGGSVTMQEALAARLALFQPSLSVVKSFLAEHPPRLNPGIGELVQKLKARGTHVYLVSGGFRQVIEPVADLLSIPKDDIYANRLLFKDNGDFGGFDEAEPTCRTGGKAVAISQIKKGKGYERLVMIGDGATDLEARIPGGADMFICYGGVQLRPNVAAAADWCVCSFDDLIGALDG